MKGLLRVTQLHNKGEHVRDFDAEEWSYSWHNKRLRVWHDKAPTSAASFEFVEFSAPVSIEFISED